MRFSVTTKLIAGLFVMATMVACDASKANAYWGSSGGSSGGSWGSSGDFRSWGSSGRIAAVVSSSRRTLGILEWWTVVRPAVLGHHHHRR